MLRQTKTRLFSPGPSTKCAWDRINIVRNASRPSALHMIDFLFSDFFELHGDRLCGDDSAVVTGLAYFRGTPVTVIAQERGSTIKERQARNYAMMHPEGYRKARRLAMQAERFSRPVICIVDTPGAYPGIGAEERGQAEAIAQCLLFFSAVKTPVVSIVLGQGGSGGALALGTADRVFMLENATYSVISPEGFASICWKDASKAQEASEVMKLTAEDLAELHAVDEVIPEAAGGLHCDPEYSYQITSDLLKEALEDLMGKTAEDLVAERQRKLRYVI